MNTNIQWLILLVCVVIATIAIYERFDKDPSVADVELARMTAVAEFRIKEKMTAMVKPISTVQVNDSTKESTYEWTAEYEKDSLGIRVEGVLGIRYTGQIYDVKNEVTGITGELPFQYQLFQAGDKLRTSFPPQSWGEIKPSCLETETAASKLLRGSLLAGAELFPPYSPILALRSAPESPSRE